MGKGTLTIYNASAGSGKTYTLAAVYLAHVFKSRYNYRRILAVTFTNKATAEMKLRILENLHRLGTGQKSDYLDQLIISTGRSEEWIREEAGEILNSILHDYSRFSVSTIDSFFQKILRAFAREAGLHSGFNIEMDHSLILSSAVDEMIKSAGEDPQLKLWLTKFALSNIEEEKSWNLRDSILSLSEELFKEKFKVLSESERALIGNKEFLLEYIKELRSINFSFENSLRKFGKQADVIFSEHNLDDSMFYQKGKGIPGFIRSLLSGSVKEPNSYVLEITGENPKWSTGEPHLSLRNTIDAGLGQTLLEALKYYYQHIIEYKTSEAILLNIYSLGILSDVLKNIHEITSSENSFLLSDAGEVLRLITAGDQASFIYEKAGNRYDNFMIDEFQDTSVIQWNNFQPLIDNSMAEGSDNLVVGDVKQSIYRWRNSDWRILGTVLNNMVDHERIISKPLTTNWRSSPEIIRFNNTLFSVIPEQIDEMLSDGKYPVSFKRLYSEAVQKDAGKRQGGYIRLEFIENTKENAWKASVLEKLPEIIVSVLEKGYKPSDIGIIVRDGREGSMVLKTLIDYNNLPAIERPSEEFRAVSNDSLLLGNAPVLNFIIAVLKVINDPSDMISRALMLRFYLLSEGDARADSVNLISSELIEESSRYFPEGFKEFLELLRHLPLFEATERIISFFKLGAVSWNVPYLHTFQDHVLNYSGTRTTDSASFLEWWETTGSNKSVVLPDNQDAVRILTIHKSKGLEFRIVILPFISWNLDHLPAKPPVLWVKPSTEPFNKLGIVPVRYSRELLNTIFSDDYTDERYSVFIDNINLLYVAFTRAKEALYGFSVDNPRGENTIASVLKNALIAGKLTDNFSDTDLACYFNTETRIFEMGEITVTGSEPVKFKGRQYNSYHVSRETDSLRLKLHGEYYFHQRDGGFMDRINYGKLMHEVFEGIDTADDIKPSVRKLVLEGKITEEESSSIEQKINSLISSPGIKEWFSHENKVLKEAGILLPSGSQRRPDRIIFRDGKTIIVDFKFGEPANQYLRQLDYYRKLLSEMGFKDIEAFIWYVDNNLVVPA
ncbi:MAG TPA: UvrD-helicase domain-containing protein [Bacteroidales bacterium]|nr:UvrD-helicase domain-containing protein [Bacteroidales bacterium]